MRSIEVLFSPAEFDALGRRDLSQTTAVVFDILRATTSIVTALGNGAEAVLPVGAIDEALALKERHPQALLAGERDGFRITARLTGSIDFDFGNSPREFTEERVRGKSVIMTTTNGTRALKACGPARHVLIGSFLNLPALASWLRAEPPEDLLLVCSGTYEEASFEDTLAAGALCEELWDIYSDQHAADSAQIARLVWDASRNDLQNAIQSARNARRLLGIPELRDDVPFCLQQGAAPLLARMDREGAVRPMRS